MEVPTKYSQWWREFRIRSDQQEKHMDFFSEKREELGLSAVNSLISIGAGCGEVDTYVIKECMPNLREYIGVEPDECNRVTLRENLKTCSRVKATILDEKVPGWSGPEEKVDMILAIQVFYYFPDAAATCRELMSWLNPGGKLIISHACDDYVLARLGQKIFPDMNLEGEYWYQELQKDLQRAGLCHYDEYVIRCRMLSEDFDMNNPLVISKMSSILRQLSEDQGAHFTKEVEKICKATGDYIMFSNVFLCIKNTER